MVFTPSSRSAISTTADSGTPMTAAWPKGDPVAHEHAIIVSWLASSARSRTSMVKFFLMLPPTFT